MKFGNLLGTLKDFFSLGKDETHGVKIFPDGQIGLYDPINGENKMYSFLHASEFQQSLILVDDGSIVYIEDGDIVTLE